jgi:hypothetical protein
MSFGFGFRTFILQLLEFGLGEFKRISDAKGGLRLRLTAVYNSTDAVLTDSITVMKER